MEKSCETPSIYMVALGARSESHWRQAPQGERRLMGASGGLSMQATASWVIGPAPAEKAAAKAERSAHNVSP